MEITLRPITNADESFLAEIMYQAIFVPEGSAPPAREIVDQPGLRKYFEGFGRSGDLGFIAIDEEPGQPVGAAWIRQLTADQPGYGYVDDFTPELTIATLPDYRDKGIGKQLLAQLFSAAQAQFDAISLSVWPENPAFQLYQRLGFVVVKENENDVTMVKRLYP